MRAPMKKLVVCRLLADWSLENVHGALSNDVMSRQISCDIIPGCPVFPKIMCLPNVIFHKVPLLPGFRNSLGPFLENCCPSMI